MRDLRAELRTLDDDVTIEWKPVEGSLLVGFVREASCLESSEPENGTVTVEEERSGTLITVKLDSPQLAALFELHNPHSSDRIGIKCTGEDPNGIKRYVMVVDRDYSCCASDEQTQTRGIPDDSSNTDIECTAATPEEREFIEHMLDEASAFDDEDSPEPIPLQLSGTIQRQEEELDRQSKTLERLETFISQKVPNSVTAIDPNQSVAHEQTFSQPDVMFWDGVPRRKRRWLRNVLMAITAIAACATGAAIPFYWPLIMSWLR